MSQLVGKRRIQCMSRDSFSISIWTPSMPVSNRGTTRACEESRSSWEGHPLGVAWSRPHPTRRAVSGCIPRCRAAQRRELGIENGADLKRLGEERLRVLLGKQGGQLYRFVRGEDDRPVEPTRERKSVGKEVTFERDLVDRDRMEGVLEYLARQVEH